MDRPQPPVEPWRRRLIRTLLYGSDVDRGVKARARVGLAVIAFALIYGVIAGRLIMFAANSEGHNVRRAAGQDAVGTARPDIFDRNGQVLATDVRSPSLFGEPHRIIDIDEAVELLTAVLTDHTAAELRERLGLEAPVRLASSRNHAEAAGRDSSARHSRHRFPRREQAGLSEFGRSLAPDRPCQHRQPGHRRHREMARWARAGRPPSRRLRRRSTTDAGRPGGRSARPACAARRTHRRRREIQGQGRGRHRCRRANRRDRRHGVVARL